VIIIPDWKDIEIGGLFETPGKGWDPEKKKAQKEFLEKLQKIKKEQWEGLNENLTILTGFIDKSASGALSAFKDTLLSSISLSFGQILAPIKNEIYAMINDVLFEALEPVMPYINDGLAWIGEALDFAFDGLFYIGTLLGEFILPIYTSARDAAEAAAQIELDRIAKARRARYQIANVPGGLGGGGRSSGLQQGYRASSGTPPEPPPTGRGGAQE